MKKEKKIGYVIEHESRGFLKDQEIVLKKPSWVALDNDSLFVTKKKSVVDEVFNHLICRLGETKRSAINIREFYFVAKPICRK
jgi:hypothetical protein